MQNQPVVYNSVSTSYTADNMQGDEGNAFIPRKSSASKSSSAHMDNVGDPAVESAKSEKITRNQLPPLVYEIQPPEGEHTAQYTWPQHYVLSFDPGTRDLGVALLAYGIPHSNPLKDIGYYVRWFALWDLKRPGNESYEQSLEALMYLLDQQAHLRALMHDPAQVHVVIELQEGYALTNQALGASLARMNGVAGAIYMYYKSRGHDVQFVGKMAKWGWSSITSLPNYDILGEQQKRTARKNHLTHFITNLIARQYEHFMDSIPAEIQQRGAPGDPLYDRLMNAALITKALLEHLQSLSFENQAHICDAVAQAMHSVRKRYRKTNPNIIDPETWESVRLAVRRRSGHNITSSSWIDSGKWGVGARKKKGKGKGKKKETQKRPAAQNQAKSKRARIV